MTHIAKGEFDVTMTPQAQDKAQGSTLGRMTIAKIFRGDLQATSKGEMLTAMMANGSAVYAAIERVDGTLEGKRGSFVLVHQGIATGAGQTLTVTIAPDSGSDELQGITGEMKIIITDDKHFYELDYALANQ